MLYYIVSGYVLLMFGFSLYYLLPQSLITMNMSQASYIFLSLMICKCCAEIILSLTLMVKLHTFIAGLFFFESKCIQMMLRKNLIAH